MGIVELARKGLLVKYVVASLFRVTWGYVSAADGQGFDEGSVTITQMQGLRAARNAGIAVPAKVIDNAKKYLEECTTEDGGVIYSLGMGRRDERVNCDRLLFHPSPCHPITPQDVTHNSPSLSQNPDRL